MASVALPDGADLGPFRLAARRLLAAAIPPDNVAWQIGDAEPELFASEALPTPDGELPELRVPRAFLPLAEAVACHASADRFALLYRLLWRIQHGERDLLRNEADPDMARAASLVKAVRWETHKTHAFVRFREVAGPTGPHFLAWFEPVHHIVERSAPFFVERFTTMCWSILTPGRSAHWDGAELRFGAGTSRDAVPDEDALEAYWRTYFSSIFNPARLNPGLMRRHMPERYWRNLPEAAAIRPLIATADARTATMIEQAPSIPGRRGRVELAPHEDHLPEPEQQPESLEEARAMAAHCRRCNLWQHGTQTVFGEGPARAPVMMIGEQPGDQEDLAGRPFVGPAGQLLDRAMRQAELDRDKVYVTNAVKHFKFSLRGKRRIHAKPDAGEIEICRWWLDLERAFVQPRLLVLMGASAARSVLGREVTISRERGRVQAGNVAPDLLVTVHPSFILRVPDAEKKQEEFRRLVDDLRLIAPYLERSAA